MNERIVIDSEIQHGKPVIRGTRVPITRIVGGLAGGMTKEEIMQEYEVTEEDIWAALNYACEPNDYVEISRRLYEGQTIDEIFERARQHWKE